MWRLKLLARSALAGVGDESKEWEEIGRTAFHLRRRLTHDEQRTVGEAIDLRGTEEGMERYRKARLLLVTPALKLLAGDLDYENRSEQILP